MSIFRALLKIITKWNLQRSKKCSEFGILEIEWHPISSDQLLKLLKWQNFFNFIIIAWKYAVRTAHLTLNIFINFSHNNFIDSFSFSIFLQFWLFFFFWFIYQTWSTKPNEFNASKFNATALFKNKQKVWQLLS